MFQKQLLMNSNPYVRRHFIRQIKIVLYFSPLAILPAMFAFVCFMINEGKLSRNKSCYITKYLGDINEELNVKEKNEFVLESRTRSKLKTVNPVKKFY